MQRRLHTRLLQSMNVAMYGHRTSETGGTSLSSEADHQNQCVDTIYLTVELVVLIFEVVLGFRSRISIAKHVLQLDQ